MFCDSGVVFSTTEYPAMFYNNKLLRDDDMFHFCIKVRKDGICLGMHDFVEVDDDRYMMVSGIGKIVFISKEELETKYACEFNNTYCKIYKANLQ